MAKSNLWHTWRELGLSKLGRSAHVLACLYCKAAIDQCALTENADYMHEAVEMMKRHAEVTPNPATGPKCRYADCIHHEVISREVGLALLRLGGEEKPWRDNRGVEVGLTPILASQDDKPPGFEIGRDAAHRRHPDLAPAAAEVYVRLGIRKAMVHIWLSPAFSSRHEDAMEAVGMWELKQMYEDRLALYREWVMAKWRDLLVLAEMDLSMEPREKRHRQEPPGPPERDHKPRTSGQGD